MAQTIALVDDDRNLLTSISIALEREGFKVQTYIDGETALNGLTRNPPDLAIIDIKMPKMDGEELLKKLRKKTSLPVIFLTSKDDEIDELLGLKLGADDFVKKSGGFSIKVLIERIRVQLRKKDSKNILEENKSLISHGRLKLDPSQLVSGQSWLAIFSVSIVRAAGDTRIISGNMFCAARNAPICAAFIRPLPESRRSKSARLTDGGSALLCLNRVIRAML